jgi:hypothetical protein
MAFVNLVTEAERVRQAASLPTREQGSILPARMSSSPLVPGWSVWEAQSRTVKVSALRWPASRDTYEDMCRDPQVQGLMMSVFLPIRHMQHYVDPAGTTGTVADEIAEDFGLPVLGSEQHDEDGPGVDYDEHIRLALLALAGGHKAFEEEGVIEGDGPGAKYRLRWLHERPNDTLERIDVTAGGDLISVRVPSADPQVGGPFIDIPAEHLLYYVWDRRGADWTGRPLLYGLYRAWLLKDEMIREDATMTRRFGGLPVAEATDPNVGEHALAQAALMAQQVQSGDGSGVATPYGTRLRILGVEGTLPKPLESVKYHDAQMARAFMQMVMELGNSQHGSRALGVTLMDHYALGVLSIAKWVRKTQMTLVRRIVERNYGPGTPLPHIRSRADEHADIPLDTLVNLIDSGAIVVDDDLEAQIRERGNLVARNPQQAGRVPTTAAAPVTAPAAASRGHAGHKRPRPVAAEAAPEPPASATTDFAALQSAFEDALAALTDVWNTVKASEIDDLVRQITTATTVAQLAQITPAPLGATELAEALIAVVEHGAQSVIDEATAQGATITPPDLAYTHAQIANASTGVATLLARSLGASAASKALGLWSLNADPYEVADEVRAHLEGLAGVAAEYELAGLASQAQNAGRFAAQESAGDAAHIYASALNEDPNCCERCREENDTEFASMEEARRDFPAGYYVGCLGGKRCRCTLILTFDEAA